MDSVDFNLITACDFTADGRLMTVIQCQQLRELDPKTGDFGEDQNNLGIYGGLLSCAGEDTYLLGAEAGLVYGEGRVTVLADPAGDQMLRSIAAYDGSSEKKTTLWKNPEGYLFFTTEEGLYSFAPGGSVTEELIDGDRTSLGEPSLSPKAMTDGEDNSFYILAYNEKTVLCHYVYDENMPTESEITLRLYSLREDEILRQAASLFQKANPNIAVDLEIGVTGGEGITEADAVKALNTRILSGDGPDILSLDGLSLQRFLEKGILLDLGNVVGNSAPLVIQVTNCFASDGKVCALPTAFAIPAIYGSEDLVPRIHDTSSLVSVVEQARERNLQAKSALFAMDAAAMADTFYDSCSAAWRKSDGTLDESKLTEYCGAMKALFAMDEDYRTRFQGVEIDYRTGEVTSLRGAKEVLKGSGCSAGTPEGMEGWTWALAGDQDLEGYEVMPLSIQAEGIFLPKHVLEILNISEDQAGGGSLPGLPAQ